MNDRLYMPPKALGRPQIPQVRLPGRSPQTPLMAPSAFGVPSRDAPAAVPAAIDADYEAPGMGRPPPDGVARSAHFASFER
jgi:hypothetical protein